MYMYCETTVRQNFVGAAFIHYVSVCWLMETYAKMLEINIYVKIAYL